MIRKMPIKLKKKLCLTCGNEDFIFSKGNCKNCALKKKALELKLVVKEKPKPIIKRYIKPKNKELETYFETQIQKLLKFKASEESGDNILFPTKGNICHLFPKRNHKSVQAHDENCIFLTWDEHNKLDNKYLDRMDFKGLEKGFPNSFKLIIERMKIVRLSITERTNYLEAFDKFIEELN